MWSLINIKETVNMQMWYLIIEIFIFKSQEYLKQIYLVNKFWNVCTTRNQEITWICAF